MKPIQSAPQDGEGEPVLRRRGTECQAHGVSPADDHGGAHCLEDVSAGEHDYLL